MFPLRPRFALLLATCRTASAHRPSGVHHSGAAYEWIGVFATNALSHTWSAQKVGGAYADPAMKLVLIETALPTAASMEKLQDLASDLMKGECAKRFAGYALRGATAGVCYTLQFDAGLDDSLFTIDTTGVAGLVIAGEHGPTEFERDRHYLYDSSGTDIEPIAQAGDADHDISFGSHSFNMALLLSLFAGLATAVGGLVVYLPESLHGGREATLACALAASGGVMLYISFVDIFAEAQEAIEDAGYGRGEAHSLAALSFFLGVALCVALDKLVHLLYHRAGAVELTEHLPSLQERPMHQLHPDEGAAAPAAPAAPTAPAAPPSTASAAEKARLGKTGVLTSVAIALHNFPEGLAVFMGTLADPSLGTAIAIAVALHNMPEGVCVAVPIYHSSGSKARGFVYALLSGLTEPLGGLLGYAVLEPFFTDLVFGTLFALVGGIMVFIVLHELLPTAHRYLPDRSGKVTAYTFAGMAFMALSIVLLELGEAEGHEH